MGTPARKHCKGCRGPMVPIVYGLPGGDLVALEERGDIKLGGCMMTDVSPRWSCRGCGATH